MNLYQFYGHAIELWNEWELRGMILLSLLLQIFLTFTGSRRKYTAGVWLGMLVWLAYLSADWLATISLGLLDQSQEGSKLNGNTSNASFVPAFWAPMLLVHLGGPETITAYSVEDNELWLRHLLQLLTQLLLACYASLRSWWSKDPLIYVAIPIFISGTIKYGERIWVLWLASSDKFRDSAKKERKHLLSQIDQQIRPYHGMMYMKGQIDNLLGLNNIISEAKFLHEAHFLFRILKLLYSDYLINSPTYVGSYRILQRKDAFEAFKLIEVELGFMFDVLFTKVMIWSYWLPCFILRFINFLSSISALLAFSLITRNFHAYSKSDIIISSLLLVGAIVLDAYSTILMLFSDWAMLWLTKQRNPLADSIYRAICSSWLLSLLSHNKRWKASMALCAQRNHRRNAYEYILTFFSASNIQSWEVVGQDLKELIFKHLIDKCSRYVTYNMSRQKLKIILEQRGDQVLTRYGCLEKLGWSVIKRNFYESFLLWHIAADRCFNRDKCDSSHCKMSISLSNYMMYLRNDFPLMLPKEFGEAKYKQDSKVMDNDVEILVHSLESLATEDHPWSIERKWEMISEVFVEMLTYVSSNCKWKEHAQALTRGGELLTLVAILMSHLGLSQQCLYTLHENG